MKCISENELCGDNFKIIAINKMHEKYVTAYFVANGQIT
jgi:hypothetical protein